MINGYLDPFYLLYIFACLIMICRQKYYIQLFRPLMFSTWHDLERSTQRRTWPELTTDYLACDATILSRITVYAHQE